MFDIYLDLKEISLCISHNEGCTFDFERREWKCPQPTALVAPSGITGGFRTPRIPHETAMAKLTQLVGTEWWIVLACVMSVTFRMSIVSSGPACNVTVMGDIMQVGRFRKHGRVEIAEIIRAHTAHQLLENRNIFIWVSCQKQLQRMTLHTKILFSNMYTWFIFHILPRTFICSVTVT